MKFLKKAALWVMATIGLLLALAGALIGYYLFDQIINPSPLLSSLASLMLVIGLASFALAFVEVHSDRPNDGIPRLIPEQP